MGHFEKNCLDPAERAKTWLNGDGVGTKLRTEKRLSTVSHRVHDIQQRQFKSSYAYFRVDEGLRL